MTEHVLFSILHRALVSDFAKLEVAVDDLTLADRVDRARAMDHWFRGFSKLVRHHHRVEHELFWPALEQELGPVPAVRQLLADFETLDAALYAVQRGFWELRHDRDFVLPQSELVARIREARRALGTYVDREEADVVPLFQSTFTRDEFPAVDPRITKGLGLGGIAFAVPWGIGAMTVDERRTLLPKVPFALRVAYRLFHRSYQRKAAALDLWAPRSLRFAAAA